MSKLKFVNHYESEPTHYVITKGVQMNHVFPSLEDLEEFEEDSEYIGPEIESTGMLKFLQADYEITGWEVPEGRERKS